MQRKHGVEKDPESQRLIDNKKYDEVRMSEEDCSRMYEDMELRQQDRFITRADQLCRCLFIISFIAMAVSIGKGVYKEVILAENIMVTVLGTFYVLLAFIMCRCSDNKTLKVALLLFVSAFIGVVAGFLIGVNLKLVVSHLNDQPN